MWDEQKRSRIQQLRQEGRALTQAERVELELLTHELETTEAGYLTSATEQLRQTRERVEEDNDALENLIFRKEALVQRLRGFLAEAQAERRAIDGELAAVLAGNRGAKMDD